MLVLGLIALLQICWLPGTLLRRAFAVDESEWLGRTAVTFGLSLIANAILVMSAVTFGVYGRGLLAVVILVELCAVMIVTSGDRRSGRAGVPLGPWRSLFGMQSGAAVAGAILSLATVAVLMALCYSNWGTAFWESDDVLNWDRWAQDWAHGAFPVRSGWYPQLMTANWSITYVLLGRTDVKMFAKATTTLFPLLNVWLFISLALRRLDAAYLFGAFFCGWIYLHNLGPAFLQIGYADVPLAFFGFLTFYVLSRQDRPLPRDAMLLALVMAAGTILVKQGGVFALVATALFVAWTWRREKSAVPVTSAGVVTASVVLGLAAVWYARKAVQILIGTDASNLTHLTQTLHHGRTYGERLVAAARTLWLVRGADATPVQLVCAVLLAAGVLFHRTRSVTLFLIVPFLLAWGIWFSYEGRTASAAFPFVALVCGIVTFEVLRCFSKPLDRRRAGSGTAGTLVAAVGFLLFAVWAGVYQASVPAFMPAWLIRLGQNSWMLDAWRMYSLPVGVLSAIVLIRQATVVDANRLRIWWPLPMAVLGVVVLLASQGSYRGDAIAGEQQALARRIGLAGVDVQLYGYFAHGQRAPVLTDYMFLRELPDLGSMYRRSPCPLPCSLQQLEELAIAQVDLGYVLIRDVNLDDASQQAIPLSAVFPTVFVESGYRLVRIDRPALLAAARRK